MSSSSGSSYPASLIQPILSRVTGSTDMNLPVLYPVEGGSINAAYQITTKNNAQWFSKINDSPAFPDLLEKESRGLGLLRMQDIFRIPAVVACETARGTQILLLEWINQGPATTAFWHLFGEQLARLHRVSAEFPSATPTFGLSWNNYMGALPQANTPTARWVDFFIQQRLDPSFAWLPKRGCWRLPPSVHSNVFMGSCRTFSGKKPLPCCMEIYVCRAGFPEK
jgi:fructosamine-3-kinase